METIQLSIPSMKSKHCMMVVSETLKELKGAALQKIAPGQIEIELLDIEKVYVIDAIEKAGYRVEKN